MNLLSYINQYKLCYFFQFIQPILHILLLILIFFLSLKIPSDFPEGNPRRVYPSLHLHSLNHLAKQILSLLQNILMEQFSTSSLGYAQSEPLNMGVITSSSASDTTPTQFFLYILALDIYLCPICLVLGPIRFFLRLLTSAWVELSLVGACLWVKMPAVIAVPFLKTRFIRHEGKFLKTFR